MYQTYDLPHYEDNEAGNPCQGSCLVKCRCDDVGLTELALDTDRRLAELLYHGVGWLGHDNSCLTLLLLLWRGRILA